MNILVVFLLFVNIGYGNAVPFFKSELSCFQCAYVNHSNELPIDELKSDLGKVNLAIGSTCRKGATPDVGFRRACTEVEGTVATCISLEMNQITTNGSRIALILRGCYATTMNHSNAVNSCRFTGLSSLENGFPSRESRSAVQNAIEVVRQFAKDVAEPSASVCLCDQNDCNTDNDSGGDQSTTTMETSANTDNTFSTTTPLDTTGSEEQTSVSETMYTSTGTESDATTTTTTPGGPPCCVGQNASSLTKH